MVTPLKLKCRATIQPIPIMDLVLYRGTTALNYYWYGLAVVFLYILDSDLFWLNQINAYLRLNNFDVWRVFIALDSPTKSKSDLNLKNRNHKIFYSRKTSIICCYQSFLVYDVFLYTIFVSVKFCINTATSTTLYDNLLKLFVGYFTLCVCVCVHGI